MANDLNKTMLTGRIVRDLELKNIPSGMAILKFTIAVNEKYKERESTSFVAVTAWAKTAEFIAKYAKKGDKLLVCGKIQTGSYDDKATGKKVYTTDIIAQEVQLMGSPKVDEQAVVANVQKELESKGITWPNSAMEIDLF